MTSEPFKPVRVGIVQPDDRRKGRTFAAHLMCAVYANLTWDIGETKGRRPVLAVFAGSDAEMPAFEANLREGYACAPERASYSRDDVSERIDFPRSAEYAWIKQRTTEGTLLTAYQPSALRFDPGMIAGDTVRFAVIPSREWASAQREALGAAAIRDALDHLDAVFPFGDHALNTYDDTPAAKQRAAFRAHVESLIPTAHLFVAALDKRVRLPIVPDLAFALQLFMALHIETRGREWSAVPAACSKLTSMIHATRESRLTGWEEVRTEHMGFAPGACCAVPEKVLSPLLAAETKRYLELRAKGRTARPSQRAA